MRNFLPRTLLFSILCGSSFMALAYPLACNKPAATIPLTGVSCAKFTPPQVSCRLPHDVQGALKQPNYNNRQRASNLFAWQTFIALNWPAKKGHRGQPAAHKQISATGPRVWETWKETREIFRDNGQRPKPWQHPAPASPKACRSKLLLFGDIQPTFTNGALPGTLTGQNYHLTRYDIRYNKIAFDYIVKHKLYSSQQQAKQENIVFPDGAILVKPAWLPLTQQQKKSKQFYAVDACVCDDPSEQAGALKNCRDQTVGLTGFHVMEKTRSAKQWIWSTFEQTHNVLSSAGKPASYHNPNCQQGRCAATNVQTDRGEPNQVTRVLNIPDEAPNCAKPEQAKDNVVQLNGDVSRALAKHHSVFQHYELIDTQWPEASPTAQVDTVFQVFPTLLGNTALETFIQETSSCMGCHAMARTNRPDQYVSADFTFTLSKAQPATTDPYLVQAPATVAKGQAYVSQTYELLPQNTRAKLHCTSCHLQGGGDRDAAWWVGMPSAYNTLKTKEGKILSYPESLQYRINGCFSRSMNGNPLCVPGEDCANNAPMQAIVAYMDALNSQSQQQLAGSARGFPVLLKQTGDVNHGAQTYLQKCAFCHGKEGQGHYASDTYYRPALWGDWSFNACAGMARVETLSAFIKANMPFEFGGALTDQEAWDLSTYIDAQCRPGKANCPNKTPNCIDGVDQTDTLKPVY